MPDTKIDLPTEIGGKPLMVTCTIQVPFERITNCITGAIEGGSTYWCNTFTNLPASSDLREEIRADGNVWYDEPAFWERGGGAHLEFDKPTDDHPGTANIGIADLVKGLSTMARVAPRHFADLVNENDDATTHDVFLQCVLFEEIIFG